MIYFVLLIYNLSIYLFMVNHRMCHLWSYKHILLRAQLDQQWCVD